MFTKNPWLLQKHHCPHLENRVCWCAGWVTPAQYSNEDRTPFPHTCSTVTSPRCTPKRQQFWQQSVSTRERGQGKQRSPHSGWALGVRTTGGREGTHRWEGAAPSGQARGPQSLRVSDEPGRHSGYERGFSYKQGQWASKWINYESWEPGFSLSEKWGTNT